MVPGIVLLGFFIIVLIVFSGCTSTKSPAATTPTPQIVHVTPAPTTIIPITTMPTTPMPTLAMVTPVSIIFTDYVNYDAGYRLKVPNSLSHTTSEGVKFSNYQVFTGTPDSTRLVIEAINTEGTQYYVPNTYHNGSTGSPLVDRETIGAKIIKNEEISISDRLGHKLEYITNYTGIPVWNEEYLIYYGDRTYWVTFSTPEDQKSVWSETADKILNSFEISTYSNPI